MNEGNDTFETYLQRVCGGGEREKEKWYLSQYLIRENYGEDLARACCRYDMIMFQVSSAKSL